MSTACVTKMVLSVCKGMLHNHGVKINTGIKLNGFSMNLELTLLILSFAIVVAKDLAFIYAGFGRDEVNFLPSS